MQWKKIIDQIHQENCIFLTFSGGDPFIRDDFLEIYAHAKKKGFLITLFTNGTLLTKNIINYLVKSPPLSIEITLNGITQDTYEAITQKKGSFTKIMEAIYRLAKTELFVILKTNCLKQNKHEIGRIKAFTEKIFGKPAKKRHHFRYDPMIYPRLDGDKTPCNYRLSFTELLEVKQQDPDIWEEYQRQLCAGFPRIERDRDYLYFCNVWKENFFINPYGQLKFCQFSDKFSTDLKITSLKEGFYNVFPLILKERFKTDSKCRSCSLRPVCHWCPARAYLETGNEEAPVEYFCQLAKEKASLIAVSKEGKA